MLEEMWVQRVKQRSGLSGEQCALAIAVECHLVMVIGCGALVNHELESALLESVPQLHVLECRVPEPFIKPLRSQERSFQRHIAGVKEIGRASCRERV